MSIRTKWLINVFHIFYAFLSLKAWFFYGYSWMSSVLNKVSPVGGNMSDSQLCVNYENYLFYSFPVIVLFPGVVLCPASWWFTLCMYRLILSQNVKVLCRFSEAFLCVPLIFFSTNFLAPNLASLYSNLCLLSQWFPWTVFGILILLHRLVISSMRQPGDNKDHVFLLFSRITVLCSLFSMSEHNCFTYFYSVFWLFILWG